MYDTTGKRDPDAVEELREVDEVLRAVKPLDFESELARYIALRFEEARATRASAGVDGEMMDCAYAYMGTYSPSEMQMIEPGTEVYMAITQTKCRALQNWMADIMQNAIDRPFTLQPTPIVDVPEHLEEIAVERLVQEAVAEGMNADELSEMVDEARDLALDQARGAARKAAGRMAEKISDQLAEGNWRDTYDQFVVDLSSMPIAAIRGPVLARKRRISYANGAAQDVEEDVFQFRRMSPFDCFPAPGAASVNDGPYFIERVSMTQSQLVKLKRAVGAQPELIASLIAHQKSGYSPYSTPSADGVKRSYEAALSGTSTGPDKPYEVLIYNGEIPVRVAMEYGMPIQGDTQDFTEVEVWVCGDYILRAVANPYPLGRRPIYAAGFQRRPGTIWFDSLPKILRNCQKMCNAAARATVKNMAFSAGPIAEVDVSLVPTEENLESVQPYKIYKVSRDPLQGDARAWHFTSIDSTSPHLIRVYDRYSLEADNISGVPAFVMGDPNVAGAGRTLGGLSMLMGNAAKGIKRVISFTDNLIMQPIVEMLFAINMLYSDDDSLKADAQVVARGAAGLLQKELSQSRAIELLQVLVQPAVQQSGYVPAEAVPKLLRDVAAGMGYDPDIIPDPTAGQSIIETLRSMGVQVGDAGGGLGATNPVEVAGPGGAGTPIPGLDGRSQPPPMPGESVPGI